MVQNIDGKLEFLQSQLKAKGEKQDLEALMQRTRELRQDLDFRAQEDHKRYEFLKEELQNSKALLSSNINKKADLREFEKVTRAHVYTCIAAPSSDAHSQNPLPTHAKNMPALE